MIQTLTKNWYLLALCGLLNAISSAIYLLMYNAGPDSMVLPGWRAEIMLLSKLFVVAGICSVAAGSWRAEKETAWLLVLNGLALSTYGLLPFLSKAISFRPFAFLVVVMAISFGVLAFRLARALRSQHQGGDKWLFGLAGAASLAFALAFLALANGWIQMERRPFHPALFLWFCLFFGFSAIAMLGSALRLHSLGPSRSDRRSTPAFSH